MYGDAFADLKTRHNVLLVGISKESEGERQLLKLPPDDTRIELGDYLIMIVNGATEKVIAGMFRIKEGAF